MSYKTKCENMKSILCKTKNKYRFGLRKPKLSDIHIRYHTHYFSLGIVFDVAQQFRKVEIPHENPTDVFVVDGVENFILCQLFNLLPRFVSVVALK